LESVKVDLFQDEVYCFTPKGDVRAFPRGSTPLDFAYAIHTDIGDHCAGARVNGGAVPLNYKLRNGDLVEVMTQPDKRPEKDWLDWAITSRARAKVRHHLRLMQREKSKNLGRELLEKSLNASGASLARLEKSDQDVA